MISGRTYFILVGVIVITFVLSVGYWFSCGMDRCWFDMDYRNLLNEFSTVTMLLNNVITPSS